MQPGQYVINIIPQPDGTARVEIGGPDPLPGMDVRENLLRVLTQTLVIAVGTPPQPPATGIQVANPGQARALLG